MSRAVSESGEILLDKLPVPKSRESRPRLPTALPSRGPGGRTKWVVGGVAIAGLVVGFVLRPIVTTDSRVGEAQTQILAAHEAAATAESKTQQLQAELTKAKSAIAATDVKLKVAQQAQAQLADEADGVEKAAKATETMRAQLAVALDRSGVATAGAGVVTLALPDKLLFKPGDDVLTDKGKQALAKLASVFKQQSELQIAVQGHTDDTPMVQSVPVVAAPLPVKKGKGKAVVVAAPVVPVVRFKTNWELSSARALAIVHYFQDVAKLDPTRLSALAFGQYRPASGTASDAENRRLELVVSPRARRALSTDE